MLSESSPEGTKCSGASKLSNEHRGGSVSIVDGPLWTLTKSALEGPFWLTHDAKLEDDQTILQSNDACALIAHLDLYRERSKLEEEHAFPESDHARVCFLWDLWF